MASELDICNLALALLGNEANVTSINPPEGSAEAEHCATFYPLARDAILSMHNWNFATTSETLVEIDTTVRGWQYVYALPNLCLKPLAVLPPEASDDYSTSATSNGTVQSSDGTIFALPAGYTTYLPQPFKREILSSGTQVILTNQSEADLIFVKKITDTAAFPPLFVEALSRLLASYLAGPIYKGKTGATISQAMLANAQAIMGQAAIQSAGSEMQKPQQSVPWMAGR